ncbi:MAG: ABC transporter substrate-binding protein [Bryobacteraceae bacterium]|jgi:iron complex transport system substrate-binding protein
MKSWLPSLLLTILVGTLAAAVGRFAPLSEGDRAARPGEGFGNPAIRTGSMDYPRETIDGDSFVVRVARPSRRIVSQYLSIDEYVYSVVPPERVVAVSEGAYEESFSNVYELARKYHPTIATDPERVLRLDPDLLIVSDSSRADFCAIVRSAQVPIYRAFTMFTTLRQVAETIRLTGYLTGEDAAAQRQIELFWGDINRAKARRPANAPHPRILGFGGSYSYGSETLFNDIVRVLGGINVGAEGGLKGYDQVNSEQIIRWNPEWIVAGAEKGKTKEVLVRLMSDPGISLTQAARNGHVLVFEQHVFLPMSPFTRLIMNALAEALYG